MKWRRILVSFFFLVPALALAASERKVVESPDGLKIYKIASSDSRGLALTNRGVFIWTEHTGIKNYDEDSLDHRSPSPAPWPHQWGLPYDIDANANAYCLYFSTGEGDTYCVKSGLDLVGEPSSGFQRVVKSDGYACGIRNGSVECWGQRCWADRCEPVPRDLNHPTQLAANFSGVCAITRDGVRCWRNGYPEVTPPDDLKNPTQIVTTDWDSAFCALNADGSVRCWNGVYGQNQVPMDLEKTTQIAANGGHVCAVTVGGVRCWGALPYQYEESIVPDDLVNPTQVIAGTKYSCALTDRGIKCWGHMTSLMGVNPLSW